jgi:formylglycine-generating enzyme required for sulfatase activity/predicted Ser/Thr protein kinase
MPLSIGWVLRGRYRIDALLGEGGMGAVYRGIDLTTTTPVAIKENRTVAPDYQKQFAREARLLHHLRHPSLPRVTDYFSIPGQGQYLVMEYVEGQDLNQVLAQRGPVPQAQALGWIGQVLDALTYLHRQDPPIIHRDVKPANVRISPGGRAFLVDFGLAKLYDPARRTTRGALGVTAGFSPLEQYGESRTDARTDVYAAGATLYALLTGQMPPAAPDLASGAAQLVAPRHLNPRVSPPVEAAIVRAMKMRAADRFQSIAEFRAALPEARDRPGRVARDQPRPAPRSRRRALVPWLLAGGTASLVLAIGIAVLATLGGRETAVPEPARTAVATTSPTARRSDTPAPTGMPAVTPTPAVTRTPAARPSATGTRAAPTSTVKPTAPVWGAARTRSADGMEMIFVPAGDFTMGSSDGDLDAGLAGCTDCDRALFANEQPRHTVYLDAFWIDRTEVTNAQYRLCVEAGACRSPIPCRWGEPTYADASKADHPVVCVTWHAAKTYCAWAGARLPTEAEWEKAARGTDGRTYPWGNDFACDKGNALDMVAGGGDPAATSGPPCDGYARTAPVASFPAGASPFGVLDMAGNAWEWVADWYGEAYYGSPPARNPLGPARGSHRVLRGGSWASNRYWLRATVRIGFPPVDNDDGSGFRCCETAGGLPD